MMKHCKKIAALFLGATMVVSALAGCGAAAPKATGAAPAPAASSGAPAAPAPAATKAPAAASKAGEVKFVFAGPNNITQWDPQNENKTNAYMLSKLYYNTLVNPYGPNNGIQPELATEWKVSPDGKEWTFKLRQGVKFHNGEVFDSASVVATLTRLHDKKTLVQAAFWPLLAGAEAVDANTVVIKLTEPWGALLTQLVDTPMLPPKMLAEKGDKMFEFTADNKIIGTGPWKCDKWTPGQDAEFVRNEEYWDWGTNKTNIDRIIYKPVIEDTTRVSGIQTGDIDMIDAVPVEQADKLSTVKGITVEKVLGTAIVHLGFRAADGRIFEDVNARQAVNHALDRALLVSSIAGGGKPSTWPAPEGVIGFDPTSPVPEYNVQMAKDLLAKTKYKGEEISFIAPTGVFARSKEVTQAVLAMLSEAGFKVKLEIMENAAFQERRAAGNYDLYIQRYPYPCGDPDSVVTQRWLNDAHKSGFKSEALNAKILAAKSESDPVKREQLLKEMFAIEWAEMAPHMAVYQQVTTIAYRDNVSGAKLRGDNVFDYSRVSKK